MKFIVYTESFDDDKHIYIVNKKSKVEYIYILEDNTIHQGTDWSLSTEGTITLKQYLKNNNISFYTEVDMPSVNHIKESLPELFL